MNVTQRKNTVEKPTCVLQNHVIVQNIQYFHLLYSAKTKFYTVTIIIQKLQCYSFVPEESKESSGCDVILLSAPPPPPLNSCCADIRCSAGCHVYNSCLTGVYKYLYIHLTL